MRISLSWIRELVDVPTGQTGRDVAEHLINAGLEVETVETVGEGLSGPIVVGKVLEIEELTEFKKPIRWCQVDIGADQARGIICGARNFAAGDLVVVAPPGTTLPGDFTITARETYGHVSDGMICSERELGLGEDHAGIIVLAPDTAAPGTDAAHVLGAGDEVLDIAITPDRGYALSARGIAREVAIAYNLPFTDPADRDEQLPAPADERPPAHCASDDLDACPLFTMRTITGIDPSRPTPQWMVNRLRDSGMRSVSLAVDITNYVMLELGQPLHAFDLDTLQGTVRAGRAQSGELLKTIDHIERELDASDLTIRDDRGPIGLAGTMGGAETEIGDSTVNIALEAAFFAPEVVARMGRRHKLTSEASRRFERGIDRALAPIASARGAELLVDLAGGTYQGMTAVEAPMPDRSIRIARDLPAQVAGMTITAQTTVDKLLAIGCEIEEDEADDSDLLVTPPTWRPDLTDPADLVEEVVRLVGYATLPSTLPTAPAGHGLTHAQRLRRRIGTVLAARGLTEVLTYPFTSDSDSDALRWNNDDPRRTTPTLANPLSDEQPKLRGAILATLLDAAQRNVGRGHDDLALFELGSVFLGSAGGVNPPRPGVTERPSDEQWQQLQGLLPDQPLHLAAVWCGNRESKSWQGPAQPAIWADAVATAQTLADLLGVAVTTATGNDPAFHPGRCAEVRIDGQAVGVAGELHPAVIEAWGLPARACALEVDITALIAASPEVRPAPDFSTHPVAKEDIALVLPVDVSAADVQQVIVEGAGELLESAALFDVYTGDQVPEGHKSLAFALRFRAPDRTLAAEEIAQARQGAIDAAVDRFGARLR
ncbi:MAG TPA: phenylalanine--tRNA ligase subunit beta [Candidatus Nanopelagicales bacterium]|nr:phenylalanine--tRNA ligase subunit beta [Candidatus Nanopelagicales bacterium]